MNQTATEPRFELVAIAEIELPEYNPRNISDRDLKKLAADIKKDPNFLKQRPPLLNHSTAANKLICYAGNQRIKAATCNGTKQIWCWIENDVPKEIQDERMLKDNLHRGEWDLEKLIFFDTSKLMDFGFKGDELNSVFNNVLTLEEEVEIDEEEVIQTVKDWGIKLSLGDVIELGPHRLVHGDSTNPEHLKALFLPEEKVDTICSDAPYGVGYVEGKKDFMKATGGDSTNLDKFKVIANDGMIQDYYAFSKAWLEPIIPYLNKKNSYYLFNGDTKGREFMNALFDLKYTHSQIIIWNKQQMVMGRKDYQPMHELIFYGWYGSHKYYGVKDKSIINCPRPQANKLHPTMKPPELLRKLIVHATEPGMIVYDAFGGSGSCLITCEQIGRKCRMMELEHDYCLVIIMRYAKYCQAIGKEPVVKVNGSNITLHKL
jgi:DNA modification methylase